MIVARKGAAYVDPFDRICHGLGLYKQPATTDSKEVSPVYQMCRKAIRKRAEFPASMQTPQSFFWAVCAAGEIGKQPRGNVAP